MTQTDGATILVVDDDEDLLSLLDIRLSSAGFKVALTSDPLRAAALVQEVQPNLMVTDLRMAGMDGMQLLRSMHETYPGLPVVMITAHGTIPDAVQATREGACAFVTKPIDTQELLTTLHATLQAHGNVRMVENDAPMVAHSAGMLALLADVRRVAATQAAVLIGGETGTGKDRIAQYLHAASDRGEQPFVAVNCGAIPEALFEAELFGHAKGAFTNAAQARDGLMASADGGTLFLDEVGDLPPPLQVKLLRALETGEIRPVGLDRARAIDVRIVAASNLNLQHAMKNGTFREDLYYRLNVVSITVPSLAERRDDIAPLANHFLRGDDAQNPRALVYAPEAMALLVAAPWPGNVRQLRNVVEQNAALAAAPVITAVEVERALGTQSPGRPKSFDEARADFTRDYLLQLLRLTDGNVARAARLAKRNRTDFYKLMQRYGVEPALRPEPSESSS